MSDPPAYPPPPDQPPTGFEPAPAPVPESGPHELKAQPLSSWGLAMYPAPDYGTPEFGHAPPQGQYRVSRNLWLIIAAVIVVVVMLVGVIGYVVAGIAFASSRISEATGAINSAQTHRTYVDMTFDLLDQQVITLDSISDAKAAKSTFGQMVTESRSIDATVAADARALVAVRARLNDQQWLTPFSQARLTAEAGRIDHARNAVATANSAAGDYVLLGQFLQAFFQAFIDWDVLALDVTNNDFVGASAADTVFQADAAEALDVSNAPWLPAEYRDYLTALHSYASDAGKELNAIATRNTAELDAADKLVQADLATLKAITFTGTTAKIRSHYEAYRNGFNAEMDKATA